MKSRLPVLLMLLVLFAPFVASLVLLDDKESISISARGQWFDDSQFVAVPNKANWQLLWREQDCQKECDSWYGLLQRVKMGLGKHSEKLVISEAINENLLAHSDGLFIADHQGLVLLSYEASEQGAYKLLKDLKVLMKHGGA
jgi:cytochrome oxidase Cu insertion factor (SCO1/SenC/PrrC family)